MEAPCCCDCLCTGRKEGTAWNDGEAVVDVIVSNRRRKVVELVRQGLPPPS